MSPRLSAVLMMAALAVPAAAQDDDLDRIPAPEAAAPAVAPAKPADAPETAKVFVENAFTADAWRRNLAVPLASDSPAWADRLSLDGAGEARLGEAVSLSYSGRLDAVEGDGVGTGRESFALAARELYATWTLGETYLEVGRINQRAGVALGYNPTDFFRARTAVAQVSADPADARDNRLGAAMIRAQTFWFGGSLTLAYAPKLADPSALGAGARDGFGPHFDRTNATDRLLASLGVTLFDLNPQVLVYHEGGRTKVGLDLSYPMGDSGVAYGEWAGGSAQSLYDEAIAFGRRTGTLPAVLPAGSARAFRNEAVAGFSWSFEDKVTLNLEYQYREASFTGSDWRQWFAVGAGGPDAAGLMWYIRGYASEMQMPVGRHQLFVRAAWDDAFLPHLSLSALSFVDPRDGSGMAQVSVGYDLTDVWSLGLYGSGNFGGRKSNWGSLHQAASLSLRLTRYL